MKILSFVFGLSCVLFLFACTVPNKPKSTMNNASGVVQWLAADALFKQSPYWRGSDDAYSIKLGKDRVLWLFGDTLISNKSKIVSRSPEHIKMLRNTVGIQLGLNPISATMKYYWNENNDISNPKPFFKSPYIAKENWLWPGDCALLPDGKTLVIFFMDMMPTNTGFHFDVAGYQVAVIKNSNNSPDKWDVKWVKNVSEYCNLKILLGSGGVLVDDDYLYAYGFSNNEKIKGITLARWSLELFEQSGANLSNPQWWVGSNIQWKEEKQLGSMLPAMLWDKQQVEFTVTKVDLGLYVMFQAYPQNGFIGNANMVYRVSRALTGPWSNQIVLYEKLYRDIPCPEDIMIYAGKYHPELTGAGFVFTYATNTTNPNTLWNWSNIYYPRFLKIDSKSFIEKLKQKLDETSAEDVQNF